MSKRPAIGIGVIGFGWMGQAHSRSYHRIPTLFPERPADPVLVACSDTVEARRVEAIEGFGFRRATASWPEVVDDPEVEVVIVTAPNMLHVEIVEAAAAAGKPVFCEKPVGGTPQQTALAERAARRAGVISGVGYNYRWAPMVLYAKRLLDEGTLGDITNYRGRFLSMYGSDPLGLLSWRFLVDEGGYGATSDILSHAVDLATFLVGPITRVVGMRETFVRERPLPTPGAASHYARGRPGDPLGTVTNEDYAGMLCVFENGARGVFEASRTMVGPESQMAFDAYGTKGAVGWNLETMNELALYLATDELHSGYTTVFGGDRFPYHGHFVPGSANSIGFEDLVTIEDYEFLGAVASGRPFHPGFDDALAWVSVQDALIRSWDSEKWEDVRSLRME